MKSSINAEKEAYIAYLMANGFGLDKVKKLIVTIKGSKLSFNSRITKMDNDWFMVEKTAVSNTIPVRTIVKIEEITAIKGVISEGKDE